MEELIKKNKFLISKCEELADKNEILQNENDKLKSNIKKLTEQLQRANRFNNKMVQDNKILSNVIDTLNSQLNN